MELDIRNRSKHTKQTWLAGARGSLREGNCPFHEFLEPQEVIRSGNRRFDIDMPARWAALCATHGAQIHGSRHCGVSTGTCCRSKMHAARKRRRTEPETVTSRGSLIRL